MERSNTKFIIILILIAGCLFFGFKYFSTAKILSTAKTELANQKTNDKVLEFTMLFIENVLKAEGEVDFEMRLQLENSVRDLNDPEILAQWTKFVESKTEVDAQDAVKDLLQILVRKIKV